MIRKFVRRILAISTDHADTPSLYCQQVGLHVNLLSAASGYIKPTPAAGISSCSMVGGERANDCQYRATTRKSCLATDKVLLIQMQCNGSVFLRITYIKTAVIQRRLAWLLARMTRKFVKRFKFSGISSDHADTPLPYCIRWGFTWICCFLAQVTSSQDLLQGSWAAAWQWGEGIKDQQFNATKSKGCLASDKVLSIQVQNRVIVFTTATHMFKLKRYREDSHDPCTRIIGKFVKRSKFLAISSDHADTSSPYQAGLHFNLLSAHSSSTKAIRSAGISC